ncbi:MAG TPA: nuclear transport factor 2 family protein [Chryseosolibacter sp.]
MKRILPLLTLAALVLVLHSAFRSRGSVPSAPTLYDTIVALDARWEDAYNHCKMEVMEELISEDLEFYHDQGGLLTSKQKLNEALKNNICGKVKRELKQGSIEVYEIKGFGAVEMGMHGFLPSNSTGPADHYAKFVHVWKRQNGKWQITRVVSLH